MKSIIDIIREEIQNSKKLYYHGRKMGGRPYSGSYIFITDDLGYASGYSDGKTLYSYTMPFGEDKIFSIKNPKHLALLRKYIDDQTIQAILRDSGSGEEIDWATLSYISTNEFEQPEELFEHMGFLGVHLKERTGIDSIYIFNEKYLKFESEIDITTPEMIKQIGKFYKDFQKDKNFLEETYLNKDIEPLNRQKMVAEIVSEEISEFNKTKFFDVPDDVYIYMRQRKFSDDANRSHMKIFRAKDGRDFLIKKNINEDIFHIYDFSNLQQPIATAVFDVHQDYFTGYEHNQSIQVNSEYRRIGFATALTDFAENIYNLPYKPTNLQTPEMQGFTKQRFNIEEESTDKPRILQVIDAFELASREADENAFGAEEGDSSWRGTYDDAMSANAGIRYQEYMKNQANLEAKRAKAKELQDKAQALANEIRKEYNWYRKSLRGKGMKQYASLSDMIDYFKKKYLQTNEGIADKYAEKVFNIPNPNVQQDIQAKGEMQKEIEKPFAYVNDVAVYKNPKSLKYIGKNIRAIGTISGNLYVSEKDGGFMHGQMGYSIGLEKDNMTVYSGKYLLLYRNGFTDEFTLSDTALNDYPKYKGYFDEVIKNIKVKNPRYNINVHDWSSEDIIQEEIQNLMNNLRFKNYPQEEYVEDVANNLQKEQRSKNDILANVDIQLADEAFRRDEGYYIGKDDIGIGGRREKIRDEILYGDLKYAPIATIIMRNNKPVLSFTDGRHRFAELRDLGAKSINIAFSKESQKYISLLQK
jgi:hypothetical protein